MGGGGGYKVVTIADLSCDTRATALVSLAAWEGL